MKVPGQWRLASLRWKGRCPITLHPSVGGDRQSGGRGSHTGFPHWAPTPVQTSFWDSFASLSRSSAVGKKQLCRLNSHYSRESPPPLTLHTSHILLPSWESLHPLSCLTPAAADTQQDGRSSWDLSAKLRRLPSRSPPLTRLLTRSPKGSCCINSLAPRRLQGSREMTE